MSALVFNRFGGIAPVMDPTKLVAPHGQLAIQCKFEGNVLRPEKAPEAAAVSYPHQSEDTVSLFHLTDRQWLRWAGDVSVARGPVTQEADYLSLGNDWRLYYAGDHGETPAWPRFSTRFRSVGNVDPDSYFDTPAFSYPLGVPPPQSVATVTLSNPPSGTLNAIRKGNPVICEGVEPHHLNNGDRVRMTGAFPGSGDGSEIAGGEFGISIVDGAKFKLDSVDGSEWAGDLLGVFTWTRVYQDQELEDRLYVYTYVNEFGEEGAPSVASALVSVGRGQYVEVGMSTDSSIVVGSSPVFQVTKKRIYRSVTGSTQADYLFVGEVDIAAPAFIDDVGYEALGEILPTEIYDLPPFDLAGITAHENGYMLGFVRNELFMSEPYLPYAWPTDYRKTLAVDNIVRVLTYGRTVVVLTDGAPYIGAATDPASMSLQGATTVFPCVHRQAAISTGYSVVYVSPLGLISFDANGPRVLTAGYYNTELWKDLIGFSTGARVALAWQDNKVWMSVYNKALVSFEMVSPGVLNIVTHPVTPAALAVNLETDTLFVMTAGANDAARRLWRTNDSDGTNATMTWQSANLVQPAPINYGWCQAFAASYPMTLTLITEFGERIYTVPSIEPFRLHAGFMARKWAIKVQHNDDLQAVHLATTSSDIKAIAL